MGTKRTGVKKVTVPYEVGMAFIMLNANKDIGELAEMLGWTKKAVTEAISQIKPADIKSEPEPVAVVTPPNPAAPLIVAPKDSVNKTVIQTEATSEAADALPKGAQVINDPTRVYKHK